MLRSSCVLLISRAVPAARSRACGYIVFPDCFMAACNRTADRTSDRPSECRNVTASDVLGPNCQPNEVPMLYAILAYHVEAEVMSWTPEADAALMTDLQGAHDRLNQQGRLGPAARLGSTRKARTLRGRGAGELIDGPFAGTNEQLLGFYVVHCADAEAATQAAPDWHSAPAGGISRK